MKNYGDRGGCYPSTWMLHVASVCTSCCMLFCVVESCCTKSETSQTFEATTPNISFVPCSPKRSATMLDPIAQLFTWTLLGPRTRITNGLQSLIGCIVPTMRYSTQHIWELLHPLAHQSPHGRPISWTMLGAVGSVARSWKVTLWWICMLRFYRFACRYSIFRVTVITSVDVEFEFILSDPTAKSNK